MIARYDWSRTYDWNYEHVPEPVDVEIPRIPGEWRFCGLPVDSPLGAPAGPLLNGRWCLYYASLGFDVVTYKTVRSRARDCYDLPNLQPVQCGALRGGEERLPAIEAMRGSWAVSYGMPSKSPDIWRADVERTRRLLPAGKLLSVSVVATVQEGWGVDELADDYAICARWALEAGADCVETNFSCPNVSTCDGQLFQNPEHSSLVARRVREEVGDAPYIVKIGHQANDELAQALLAALAGQANAVATTNSIAATVVDARGNSMFGGQPRGICGSGILEESIRQVTRLRRMILAHGHGLELIGVGGASNADHVLRYLNAGAHAVHLASAAMVNPTVALEIRKAWPEAGVQDPSASRDG